MDYDEEQDFYDMEDVDDARKYDIKYIKKLKDLTDPLGAEVRDDIIDEMQTIKYNATNNPTQDAELNYLRSRNILKRKQYQFSKSEESFLRYQADADGISLTEAKRNARKILKKGGD